MQNAPLVLIVPGKPTVGPADGDSVIQLSEWYARALEAAGAIPWVLPRTTSPELIAECVRRCDGVLLPGGDDMQPRIIGRPPPAKIARTLVLVDAERDLQELMLIDEVFRQRKSLFAICRGMQTLNVALGGTLIYDIALQRPGGLDHARREQKEELVHDVTLTPDSLLAKITGRLKLDVNSSHHQAVGRVPKLLRVTATSSDGIVEALELNHQAGHLLPYLLAVQCHPERLFTRYPRFLEWFKSFVQACRQSRK